MLSRSSSSSSSNSCSSLAAPRRVDVEISRPQAICICPTRELVIQNLGVLKKMAARTNPPITARATSEQEERVRGQRLPPITEHVVIGTPGTLDKWIARRRIALDAVRVLVFDEADQMLMTEGFKDVSFRMLNHIRKVSPDVQILLFSATFSDRVREYCNKARAGSPAYPVPAAHVMHLRLVHDTP
jgi:ATP-dependent RNA helicase DDX19/DBP5